METSPLSTSSRDKLIELLSKYRSVEPDNGPGARILSFVHEQSNAADRSNLYGHLTGSAWVVNEARDKVLLLHHKKLNRWMQLGGHADGDFDLLSVALREAKEESGLSRIKAVTGEVFDVDVHEIPAWKDVPAHYHFDVRFLLCGDDSETPSHNEESHAVAWVSLSDIHSYTDEESVLRMARLTVDGALVVRQAR
jgi:8-oxo-dGTP pyrophosphatase MutT (NUDIX family)